MGPDGKSRRTALRKDTRSDTQTKYQYIATKNYINGLTSDLSFTIMGERKVTRLFSEVCMAKNTKEKARHAGLDLPPILTCGLHLTRIFPHVTG